MMRYEGDEKLADTSPCAGVRADLKMCLLQSDCCKKVGTFTVLVDPHTELFFYFIGREITKRMS